MGENSNENPERAKKKAKVVAIPFCVNEKEIGIVVPPRAKSYEMTIGEGEEFIIGVHEGTSYQIDENNIIHFKDGGKEKSGKLVGGNKSKTIVPNSEFEKRRQAKKKSENEIEIA